MRPDVVTYNIVLGFLIDQAAQRRDFGSRVVAALRLLQRRGGTHPFQPDVVMHVLLLRAVTVCHRDLGLTARTETPLTVADRFSRSLQKLGLASAPVEAVEGDVGAADEGGLSKVDTSARTSVYAISASRLLRGLWTEAKATVPLDARYYNTLIAAFARAGNSAGALSALREMREKEGVDPDLYTFNALLSAASHAGDVAFALRLLESLKRSRQFSADVHSYSAALSACRNDVASSKKVLAEAISSGLPLSPAVLNAALQCYGGDVERSIEAWVEWRGIPDLSEAVGHVEVYRGLMRSAGMAGRPDVGLKVLISGRKRGEVNPATAEGLFGAFTRGMHETDQARSVRSNLILNQYLEHLRLECRAFSESSKRSLPFERVRIKW